jgi:hypothetical protein
LRVGPPAFAEARGSPASRCAWAWYAAPLAAGWLLWWVAFFPGVVSNDPLYQWQQIVRGRYDQIHPVFHTWLLWLLTRVGHSFGTVSLVQVVLTAVLLGRGFAEARRLGAPAWLTWGIVAWLAISPAYGRNVIAVWKDNAFGLAVLAVALLLLRAREDGILSPGRASWLGGTLALVCLLRLNGAAVALPVLALVAWWFWGSARREVLRAGATCVGLVVLADVVAHATHVHRTPPGVVQQALIQPVAALVKAGTPMPPSDRRALEEMAPLAAWGSDTCERIEQTLVYSRELNQTLWRDPRRLLRIGGRLAITNPRGVVAYFRCATRYLWAPESTLNLGNPLPLIEKGQAVNDNAFGLRTTPLLPRVNTSLTRYVVATLRPGSVSRFVVWQPAFPLYLALAVLPVALWRGVGSTVLTVLAPPLVNTAQWLFLSIGPYLRYHWPLFLVVPLAVCLSMGQRARHTTISQGSHPGRRRERPGRVRSHNGQVRMMGRRLARVLRAPWTES